MFLVYFLLLLIPLVFFHELGHFLVARWMGVRVLSFSIGFGPVVFAREIGGTEYALRLLPLGGYVKMLGDDPMASPEEVPPEPDAFSSKAVWRRALIVLAGPLANLLLPLVILLGGSLLADGEVLSSRVGTVLPGGPADQAGVRPGDRIVAVDGEEVDTFLELSHAIGARPGALTQLTVERDGARIPLSVRPVSQRDVKAPEIGVVDTVGRIMVLPDPQRPVLHVAPGSPAARAGLRTGDRVMQIDGKPVDAAWQLWAGLAAAAGREIALAVASPRLRAPLSSEEVADLEGDWHDVAAPRVVRLPAAAPADLGITIAESVVGMVQAGSPAAAAGLRAGDAIVAVDGEKVGSFMGLGELLWRDFDDARVAPGAEELSTEQRMKLLAAAVAKPRQLEVWRPYRAADLVRLRQGGEALDAVDRAISALPDGLTSAERDGSVRAVVPLRLRVELDGSERPRLLFGASALQGRAEPERIANADPLGYAWLKTRDQLGEALRMTVLSVAGLFRGRVPVKDIGGPIFMGQLASKTSQLGWGYFFQLMVMLSVNLAILNLLPIPIADGGHLLFLGIEAVRREPVSLRTRMIAAYAGLTFLALLFVVVMMNDVQRLLAPFLKG